MRSSKQLREEQLNDIDIRPVFTWLENLEEPSPNELYDQGIVTKLCGEIEIVSKYVKEFCTMSGLLMEAPVGAAFVPAMTDVYLSGSGGNVRKY